MGLTEHNPARVSQVSDARPANPRPGARANYHREPPGAQGVVAGLFWSYWRAGEIKFHNQNFLRFPIKFFLNKHKFLPKST